MNLLININKKGRHVGYIYTIPTLHVHLSLYTHVQCTNSETIQVTPLGGKVCRSDPGLIHVCYSKTGTKEIHPM